MNTNEFVIISYSRVEAREFCLSKHPEPKYESANESHTTLSKWILRDA